MENPNTKRNTVSEAAAEVGESVLEVGSEVAVDGIVGVVIEGALGVAETAVDVAGDVVGGILD